MLRPAPILFAVLATGCADEAGWPVAADPDGLTTADELAAPAVRPPPGVPLVLDAGDVMPGQMVTITASSADPGETVRFLRGASGIGAGPCPAALGGLCLDVRNPTLMGSATANAQGIAEFSFQVPAGAPNGAGIWFQACAARGQGGANSVESQVEGRVIGQSSGMPWRNSWTVDGDASDWLPEETFGTTSQTGAWAVTWDDDMLYVGVSHPDIANGGAQHWSLVYLGTGTGGTDDGVLHNTQQPSLPFVTSHLVRRKADGSYDSLEHHDGQAWNSTSPWLGTAGSQVAEQGDVLEMAIPLDAIDSPEVIELFAALIFEGGGYESTYAGVPSNSFVDGYDPDPIDVFTFDLQSSDPPTAQ